MLQSRTDIDADVRSEEMAPNIQPDNDRLERIAKQVGLEALRDAFRKNTFVYGTLGNGSLIVCGLKRWLSPSQTSVAARARRHALPARRGGPTQQANVEVPHRARPAGAYAIDMGTTSGTANRHASNPTEFRELLGREVNLFDPGRRANYWIDSGCQMMDLYYGQAGTNLHEKRIPIIAKFVHQAMEWNVPFSMERSGRDIYMEEFNTAIEGYWDDSPSRQRYNGLTATKEMSRIIRWGISRFGGTLIFEGRELYYSQVFKLYQLKCGDTDLEARELFKHFEPGQSKASFGSGEVIFYWGGRECVPTQVHFLSNWTWHASKRGDGQLHSEANYATEQQLQVGTFLPIWHNFQRVPGSLSKYSEIQVLTELTQLSGSVGMRL